MKRILIIANKNWEVIPLLSVLLSPELRPKTFINFELINAFREREKGTNPDPAKDYTPRLIYKTVNYQFEIWCIQDLMNTVAKTDGKDVKISSSSSFEKYRVMPYISTYSKDEIALVIAFGTAGFPDPVTFNGSVSMGSHVFLHNPKRDNPNPGSPWDDMRTEQLILSDIKGDFFDPTGSLISIDYRTEAESRFINVPNYPAKPIVISAMNYLALSIVNITNYDDYAWADHEGIEKVKLSNVKSPIGSFETTHGLIRLSFFNSPFIFISGITDRLGYFNMEVNRPQNYVAAFNAGIAAAWLIPRIEKINPQ